MSHGSESIVVAQQKRENLLVLARSLFGRSLGFKDCQPETIDELIKHSSIRVLTKGEVMAQRGDLFDGFCLVVEGSLEASIVRKDGHRHLMHFLQPGDLVGLINIVDRQGLVNDLISRFADTVVLFFPGDFIREMRARRPDLASAIEVQIVFRSRLLYERLAADQSITLENRLAKLLLTLSDLYGLKRDDGVLLDVRISQADLADWLGVSRQRINTATQLLKSEGLISLGYSSIVLRSVTGLKSRIGE
jgi:CRP/FNR family cyclic AMP-dependent transcriptional regulator